MKQNFLPIAVDISDQKILIIGGDQSAYKKMQILQRHGAKVEVIGTKVCNAIKESGVTYFERPYDKSVLPGYLMLYCCTNKDDLDRQIVKDGKDAGVLVNIHDKPDLCRFISPAIYRSGNISVAVSSNGEDVYESIRIRNLIRDELTIEKPES